MRYARAILLLVFLLAHVDMWAGDRWNVRGMGMARTILAGSRGSEALGINPANLAIPDRCAFTLSLIRVGTRVSTELFSYDIYQEYFTGVPGTSPDGTREPKYLTNEDKEKILSSFPEGVAATRFDLEAMLIGVSVTTGSFGGIGFAMVERAGAVAEIPNDYARFFLYGLDSTGSRYRFDGTNVAAWWWREYNFSYGVRIPVPSLMFRDLYAGIGFKILRGYGLMETQRYSGMLANERVGANQYQAELQFDYLARRSGVDFLDENRDADFTSFPEPAGKGVGFDIGLSARLLPGLLVAASVTDIGSIHWEKNVVETFGQYNLTVDDPFEAANADSLERAVRGTNRAGEPFSTSLPATLRLGAAIESQEFAPLKSIPGQMLLAFDYTQGLNSSLGNTTKPRISVGVEYRPIPFVPLRTGISVGGGEGLRWAAGFGLDFHYFNLDVATENVALLFTPNEIEMISVAAGLRVRF